MSKYFYKICEGGWAVYGPNNESIAFCYKVEDVILVTNALNIFSKTDETEINLKVSRFCKTHFGNFCDNLELIEYAEDYLRSIGQFEKYLKNLSDITTTKQGLAYLKAKALAETIEEINNE